MLRQERHRDQLLELAPQQVDRELRSRHVRDDQVEQPRREVQARRHCEERRRREVLDAGDDLGPERLLRVLEPAHRATDDAQPLDRVVGVDGQRAAHGREPVAELVAIVPAAYGHRH